MHPASKILTSENPIEDVWKYLRLFLHHPFVEERIRNVHNLQKTDSRNNVRKQATQLGYCIRQAEEYFKASSQVGLATRPVLLYYGAVSLTQALILLKQSGEYSFDALRKTDKHSHHGLDRIGFEDAGKATDDIEQFFSVLRCRCHTKDKEGQEPWGQFPIFYQSLEASHFIVEADVHEGGKTSYLNANLSERCSDMIPLATLSATDLNVLDILKTLPDLYYLLHELGVRPELRRGDLKRTIQQFVKPAPPDTTEGAPVKPEQPPKMVRVKTVDTSDMFINDLDEDQKNHFLDFYRQRIPKLIVVAEFPNNLHLNLIHEIGATNDALDVYYPDIVEDLSGAKFYIVRPESYLHEPAAFFVILYCLGHLARYYPDIWMKAIDTNSQIRELTNSLLNIAYRKFPNLILDQLTNTKHHIHI